MAERRWSRARVQQILAAHVRRHRQGQGLRQVELAARTGYAQASISRIERGQQLPSMPQLLALANALGVPPWGLLYPSTRGPRT